MLLQIYDPGKGGGVACTKGGGEVELRIDIIQPVPTS